MIRSSAVAVCATITVTACSGSTYAAFEYLSHTRSVRAWLPNDAVHERTQTNPLAFVEAISADLGHTHASALQKSDLQIGQIAAYVRAGSTTPNDKDAFATSIVDVEFYLHATSNYRLSLGFYTTPGATGGSVFELTGPSTVIRWTDEDPLPGIDTPITGILEAGQYRLVIRADASRNGTTSLGSSFLIVPSPAAASALFLGSALLTGSRRRRCAASFMR